MDADPTPVMHPLPSGTRDVLPDEMARAARDHRRRCAASFDRRGLRRGCTRRRWSSSPRHGAVGDAGPPAYRHLRRPRQRCCALRSDLDNPDRAGRGDALRRGATRRCASSYLRATPTARCARTAARCASSCRPGCELVGAPKPDGTVEVLAVLCRHAGGRSACTTSASRVGERGDLPGSCFAGNADVGRRGGCRPRGARAPATGSASSRPGAGLDPLVADVAALRVRRRRGPRRRAGGDGRAARDWPTPALTTGRSPPGSSSTSDSPARIGYYTGAIFERATRPGRGRARWAAVDATTTSLGRLRPRRSRRSASRSASTRSTPRWPPRSAPSRR